MAFDAFDYGIAIVNGLLFHSEGTSWTQITLPAPINSAGDSPAPTSSVPVGVDSIGNNSFYVLTTSTLSHAYQGNFTPLKNRTWLFTGVDGGLTLSDWSSEAVHNDVDYNFYGLDVNNKNGFPYIITNKFSDPNIYVSNIVLSIGGSTMIQRGLSLSGPRVSSFQYSGDDDYGIVPRSRASSEQSRIIRIWQDTPEYLSTGLIDPFLPFLNVTVRLVLGYFYPRLQTALIVPNLYFRPFVGYVIGGAGIHGTDNDGALYGGYELTRADIQRGYIDLTISPNKLLATHFNNFGGFDVCFYVGHTTVINGQLSSQIYFNNEPKYFDSINPFDPDLPPYLQNLWTGFNGYPFTLSNLSIGW